MSKPTLEDISRGLFWTCLNLNGKCPYCFKKLSGEAGDLNTEFVWYHYEKEHQS